MNTSENKIEIKCENEIKCEPNSEKGENSEIKSENSEPKKTRGRPKTKTEEEKKEAKRLYMKEYYKDPENQIHIKEKTKKHYQEHPDNYRKQGYIMIEKYKESYKIIKELQSNLKDEFNDTNEMKNILKNLKMKIITI